MKKCLIRDLVVAELNSDKNFKNIECKKILFKKANENYIEVFTDLVYGKKDLVNIESIFNYYSYDQVGINDKVNQDVLIDMYQSINRVDTKTR